MSGKDAGSQSVSPEVRPDHFCIRVDDLLAATRAWEALGFIVTQGSNTGGGGGNALIVFSDGVYIELVKMPAVNRLMKPLVKIPGLLARVLSGERAFLQRFLRHWTLALPGKWIDWCLAASPLESKVEEAKTRGVNIPVPPYTFSRKTAGGGEAKWRMVGTLEPNLPFLIEDVPGFMPRAPIRLGGHHPNGAYALRRVVVGSREPEKTLAALAALTGLEAGKQQITIGSIDFVIELEADRVFTGPLELVFSTTDAERDGDRLDTALTGGARISLEADTSGS